MIAGKDFPTANTVHRSEVGGVPSSDSIYIFITSCVNMPISVNHSFMYELTNDVLYNMRSNEQV